MKQKTASLAKTARPNLSGVFPRKRLFRLLDHARKRPIVWVTGPPGSGKTTLVASYVNARQLSAMWYQVDEDDGDVATFFYYMGLAAGQAAPRYRRPLPLLTPEYQAGLAAFARSYFQELYGRLKPPFAVVFDNYHEVQADSPLHEIMREALSQIPERGKVVVISRGEPPPSLARLRVSHAIEIVGWDALRLTYEEAEGIARLQGSAKPSKNKIRRSHEKTDGWVAGLVLMLESAEPEDPAPSAAREFIPEAIFDYFAGEIFQKEEPKLQSFLLKSAFLSSATARMAADLTGLQEADRILSGFNRNNYFTERRFHSEPVYQYHPLFRGFLMARAKATFSAARLSQVQRRAAALLAAAGEVEDAATLLREAGDRQGLAQLIMKQAPSLMAQGRISTLQEWLGDLPQELVEGSPWLQYWLGACQLPLDPARSRTHFVRAFELFKAKEDLSGAFRAWSDIVETVMYEWGDFKLLDEWIRRLEDLLGEHPHIPTREIECRVASSMFFALMFRQPDHPRLSFWRERALSLSQSDPDVNHRVMTGYHVALYHLWMGNLGEAAIVIDLLRQAVRSPDASPLARLTLCEMEAVQGWFRASSESCLKAVEEGLKIADATGIRIWDYHLIGQAVYLTLSTGDIVGASEWLKKLASVLDKTRHLDIGHYHFLSAWLALSRGDLPLALQHAESAFNLSVQLGTPFPEALTRLAMAQVLHEHGREKEAERHLARARLLGRDMGSPLLRYMSFLAEAQFLLDRGKLERSPKCLSEAMKLGREHGYLNTPWWRPSVMTRLCTKALEAGIEVRYVQDLIRKRHLVLDIPPLHVESWPWPLRIYTLGKFQLVKEGKPVQFSRKVQQRPLSMLKALVAFGGRDVPEDQLFDALWPEAEGDVAHQAFATTLHRLRQLLGNEKAVLLQGGRVTLDPHCCWVDTWAFERLLEQAEEAEIGGQTDEALRLIEKALKLHRGPFLSGESAEPWALSLRERLRAKFVRLTARLGEQWERAGKFQKAIECYEKGLEADELTEQLYRQLIYCYARQGRRAEALAVYQRCRKILAAAFGVAPSSETEALYHSLGVKDT